MDWLRQLGPWCPGAGRVSAKEPAAVRRPGLLRVPVRDDRARPRGGSEAQHSRAVESGRRHDEPAAHLDIYRDVFSRPAAILYNTESERRFLQGDFPERPSIEEVVGVGVDIPQHNPYPRMPAPVDDDPAPDDEPQGGALRRATTNRRRARFPSHLLAGARCSGAVTVCTARCCSTAAASIRDKGCEELIEYFSGYIEEGGDATLALVGVKLMSLPEDSHIRFAGLLLRSRAAAVARSCDCRRLPLPARWPVARRSRGPQRRHAHSRQRTQSGAGRALRRAATAGCITPIGTSSSRASSCSWATRACAPRWAEAAATTCGGTIAGKPCLGSTSACWRRSATPSRPFYLSSNVPVGVSGPSSGSADS